jgi:hypothetical protein
MSQKTGPAWNTKYGPRRVRHDPPTLAEAIAAARDLTDQLDQQAEIAASLMGLSQDQVKAELAKLAPQLKNAAKTSNTIAFTGRAGVQRAVIVERKPSRRVAAGSFARKLNSAG